MNALSTADAVASANALEIVAAEEGGRGPSGRSQLLRSFLDGLDRAGVGYCLLAGYESFPEIPSDVDFMVSRRDLQQLPELLSRFARDTGTLLVNALEHETSACTYIVAIPDSAAPEFLWLDATSDYRRSGRLWLRADQVLARRRTHPNGFFVASAEHDFLYYFLKKVDKTSLDAQQFSRLLRSWSEVPNKCAEAMANFWVAGSVRLVQQAFQRRDLAALQEHLPELRRQLQASAGQEGLGRRASERIRELRRCVRRFLTPTGALIAFLGPDGCGKSTVIAAVAETITPAFRESAACHLRPSMARSYGSSGGPVTDPHARSPRGWFASLAKLCYWLADYAGGYVARVRPQLTRSVMVVFDRYYHDLLVDPRRYRYGAPMWLARLVGRLVPHPDIWIVLDAPAEVLQARKQEVAFAETARQREQYLAMARELNAVVVDAAHPVEFVVADVNRAILNFMATRTRRRLELASSEPNALAPQQVVNDRRLAALLPLLARGQQDGDIPVRAHAVNANELAGSDAVVVADPSPECVSQLRAAGFAHIRRYRARPNFQQLRWLIPHGAIGRHALRQYVPITVAGSLLKVWTKLSLQSNRSTLLIATRQLPALENELSRQLGHPVELALSLGTPGAYNKTTVTVLNRDGETVAFAKVASSAMARKATLHEEGVLRSLAQAADLAVHVPVVKASFTLGHAQILLTSAGSERRSTNQFMAAHQNFLDAVAQHTVQTLRFNCSTMWRNMQSTFDRLRPNLQPAWRERLQQMLGVLAQNLGNVVLPMGLAHGDFVPWNIRQIDKDRIYVFDWEFAREQYVPGYDYFHFQFMTRNAKQRRCNPREAIENFRKRHKMAADPALMFAAYVTDMALLYLDALHATGGPEGDVIPQLAAVLDGCGHWLSGTNGV